MRRLYLYAYDNPIRFTDVDGLYGDENEANRQRQTAIDQGVSVGDVYQSGDEWGFNVINGEDSYSSFDLDFSNSGGLENVLLSSTRVLGGSADFDSQIASSYYNGDPWNAIAGSALFAEKFATNGGLGSSFTFSYGASKKTNLTGTTNTAAKGTTTYTKSSLKLGQQMHEAYKAGLHNPGAGLHKEFRLLSGKRIDFLDMNKGIIYELKPFNPRAMQAGQRQLQMYMRELQSPAMLQKYPQLRGINWKTVLDTY